MVTMMTSDRVDMWVRLFCLSALLLGLAFLIAMALGLSCRNVHKLQREFTTA